MKISRCSVIFGEDGFQKLHRHLFPGDGDEHAAILCAGISVVNGKLRLLVRDVYLAKDGVDFIDGTTSYKTLRAEFIYPHFRHCRNEKLAYLAVHNHGGDNDVEFSRDDWDSHERNYPTMLSLARGLPVGALVFARNAVAGDIWMPDGQRLRLNDAQVLGANFLRLYPSRRSKNEVASVEDVFVDRQLRIFGRDGQRQLSTATVAVIGAGGAGSLIIQYLSHLGVGNLVVVDSDRVSLSNLSRLVGATRWDARYPLSSPAAPNWIRKFAESVAAKKTAIAERNARTANPAVHVIPIDGDIAADSIARQMLGCDFVFLAADSMRARLVFNALVHQYFVPGIQVGAKVRVNEDGRVEDAYSVVRWMLPGKGCLWCSGFISPSELAVEAKSDAERADQAYGTGEPNPSVISLNAVAASHAVTEFQMAFLSMHAEGSVAGWHRFKHVSSRCVLDVPTPDPSCSECQSSEISRFARGDSVELPTYLGQ